MSPTPTDLGALEAVLARLPAALFVLDPATGRLLFANDAARTVFGDDLPAVPVEDWDSVYTVIDERGRPRPVDMWPAARALRGERLVREQVDWLTPAGRRTILLSSDVLEIEPHGRVLVLTMEDVTTLEGERRRTRALSEATAALAAARDFDATLEALADALVPALADWCFVELLQPDGSIERTAIRGADPEKHALVLEYDKRFPLDPDAPVGSAAVIRTGQAELTPDIPPELFEAVATSPEHLRILQGLGFRSFLIVPLRVSGEVIGDLALAHAESGRRFDDADLAAAEDLAARCSLFLENARLYDRLRAAGVAERAAREELEAILEGVADGVIVQEPAGGIVYANQAAATLLGYATPTELAAAPLETVRRRLAGPDRRPIPPEQLPGRLALEGEEPEPMVVRYLPGGAGGERWARLNARGIRDADGRVRLAITAIEDITDIKQAEYAQGFLAEASRLLASSLDYERTLARVAELAVPEIADWCAVDLAADDGYTRVAVQHKDPAKLSLAHELSARYPPDPESDGVLRVLRTGESELYPEIPDSLIADRARDAHHLELMRSVGMVSAMIVPLRLRDEVMGTITFVTAESGRRFSWHDLELAEELAVRAATAVDNARLYSQRSAIAQTLQASLLPPELPAPDGLECAAVFRPAGDGSEVGGDFYDVFDTAPDQWFAVIGDVCGKGAEAAATTALARYTVRAAAVRRRSPAQILRWLNDAMLRQDPERRRFSTIAIARFDVGSNGGVRMTVACGGHPLPRIVRAGGEVDEVGRPGTLLGVTEEVELEDATARLEPGDALVLYTDGLTEAGAPERIWAPEDLDAALARAHEVGDVHGLVARVTAAALGDLRADTRDDVAVLALQVR